MKIKELKEFINSLPEEFGEYNFIYQEVSTASSGDGEDYMFKEHKPIYGIVEVRNEAGREYESPDGIIPKLREEVNLLRKEKDNLISKNFDLKMKVDNYENHFSWTKINSKDFKTFPRENERILIFRANHFFLATTHIDKNGVICFKDYLYCFTNYFENGDMILIIPKPIG